MAFLLREHFKNKLHGVFGLKEDEIDDIIKDTENAPEEAPADGAAPAPEEAPADPNTDNNAEAPAEAPAGEDNAPEEKSDAPPAPEEDDAEGSAPAEPESEQVPGTGDIVQTEGADDGSKVTALFTDIGKPETDFGLSNPNNIRLAKFRFKKAGIDINQLMNDVEKKAGLSVEKLIYRLTPEQYESYKEKGKAIRQQFDLINMREKNIIMFNSRIPIYNLDQNTKEVQKIDESNPNLLKNAYKKIDEFMTKRFGEEWVDDLNAIDFLQGIKVNFNEKESITPNMITTKFFKEDKLKLIPFNKLFVKAPKSVEDFVKENKDNQNFLRSAVFRTIAAGYIPGSTDSNGVYAILTGDAEAEGEEAAPATGSEDNNLGGNAESSPPEEAPAGESEDTGAPPEPAGGEEPAPEAV